MIYRIVAIVIIIAGFKFAWNSRQKTDGVSEEQAYHQKMSDLATRYDLIEREGVAANEKAESQPAKTPGSAAELLNALGKIHRDKDKYLADLQALDVPKKYQEAHETFLAWKKQEQETEAKLIEGYVAFNQGKKDVANKIDSMIEASDRISKEYEQKLSTIAKQNGFDSFQKYFTQPAATGSKP